MPSLLARHIDIHVSVYEAYGACRIWTSRSGMYCSGTRTNTKPSHAACRRCPNGQSIPAILTFSPEDAFTASHVLPEDSILAKVHRRSCSNQTTCLGRSAVPPHIITRSLGELHMRRIRYFRGSRWSVVQQLAGICLSKAPATAEVTTVYHGIAVNMHVSAGIRLQVQ